MGHFPISSDMIDGNIKRLLICLIERDSQIQMGTENGGIK
ncbi:hypothetical protein N007_20835 [Alicyclobacillus acidoterrestris ATCC 49025]|nr:hypothetical protein N007_20835 [Alicyclobacillus acidoterrestris ATCC 49025]